MIRKIFILLFIGLLSLASLPALGQSQQPITFSGVTAVQVPLCSSGCQNSGLYTTVMNQLCSTNNPAAWAIKGFSPLVPWNYIDDAGGSTSDTAPSYDWRNLDTAFNAIISNCPAVAINPIVEPALEGGNNNATPRYVFNATYASNVGAAQQQDISVSNNYQGAAGTTPFGNANGASGCLTGCEYNLAACVTGGCTFAGGDVTGLPVFVPGEPITIAFSNFLHEWYLHFSSTGNCATGTGSTLQKDCSNVSTILGHIGVVRFGGVAGGENSILGIGFWRVPPAFTTIEAAFVGSTSIATGQNTSYTCGVRGTGNVLSWTESLINKIATEYAAYTPSWSVMADLHDNNSTPNHAYGGCTAIYVQQYGLMGFGTNGVQQSDMTILPTGKLTQTNWAGIFATDLAHAHELQQLGFSDPTPTSLTPCVDANGPTGSLANLGVFIQQHGATIWEIYATDLGFTYISNWNNMPTTGGACSQTNWQSHYAQSTFNIFGGGAGLNNPYATVINGFAQRVYTSTSATEGTVTMIGTAAIQ